ncbi:conserved hypothetical protein [Talaromyces stipitatus ATCC 10500]|uniref:Uncharacterized protein n=1 Tax=Talaromyces stipitatus (strain ATCC 10500 / CBS 375.48 / QM 6759 / NRRL 1006) TaxID=441959 RepID=B8LV04_TALSN|nr:uncharacterized protein TSTA_061160 [Talaromyces stipitatus ATCC 10500]EED22625.1 conserved hypothetical protein [Talaromyces stipitatus ATCC 10500]
MPSEIDGFAASTQILAISHVLWIAPGPGGTTMLGERGGIEAAAQRGLERRQREKEETAAREGKFMNGAMSDSGTTLTPENDQPEENERVDRKTDLELHSKKIDGNISSLSDSSEGDNGSAQKQSEGRWERFTKRFQ